MILYMIGELMTHTINISTETFQRLEAQVVGFDNPESVIKRLLDEVEGKVYVKPTIRFDPEDEAQFKKQLLLSKKAEITLIKRDGTREIIHWNAIRFSEQSNLRANLWSGYLRGWKNKKIIKAELVILSI